MKPSKMFGMAAVVLALLMTLFMLPAAQGFLPAEPVAVKSAVPLADDGGAWEVGAEAAGGSLSSYAYSEASNLYNRLRNCGWNGRFLYSTSLAWEEDFKRSAAGGTEHLYLDTVDLMFYVGHGSPGGFTFDPPYHDDSTLTPSDCNYAWGDGDNEWVALTSCQVLADSNRSQWAACMAGTHLILGFVSNASAFMGTSTQGYRFANNICNGWTVTGAWFKACDNQVGHTVRALAEENDCFYDKPSASSVCSDAWDYDYYYWTHSCGAAVPSSLTAASAPDARPLDAMPIFRTPPLSLAEAQNTYSHLGDVFDIPPSVTASAMQSNGGVWRSESDGRELEMDSGSGGYNFYDMNNLWSQQQVERFSAAGIATISADDARAIADNFLQQNGLMSAGAQFLQVVSDTLTTATRPGGAMMATEETQVTAWEVQYTRMVSAPVASAAGGPATAQEFPVVGSGARLTVYVDATAARAASNGTGAILGTLGGWARVEQPAVSAAGVESVPVLTPEQIYTLFNQLESRVVVNTPPIDADQREILGHTLAYWEEGMGTSQGELMPVYALNVRYSQAGAVLAEGPVYVPANQNYMRPFARIESAPTDPVRVGQVATLTATDATKTLAQLGYDASLNFALGSGDYIYDWFVGSVEEANRIGSGRILRYTVRADAATHGGAPQQTVILRVTDIGTADQRSTTADVSLNIQPRILLPILFKQ
jgi:hypothetical protein